MARTLFLIIFLFFINHSIGVEKKTDTNSRFKQFHVLSSKNNRILCQNENVNVKIPSIYCYDGKEKRLVDTWRTVSVSLNINDDLFEQFVGFTPEEVLENFNHHQSLWSANIFSFRKRKSIELDPFNKTCIGILTTRNYTISLIENDFNYFLFVKFVVGVLLFLYASHLSQNQIFYYLCGILFGICGSILIVIFILSRIFPNKTLMYGAAVGGSTLVIVFLQYLLDHAKLILLQYNQYVFGYIVVSGIISFAFCYRFGPLTNPRSRNLIKWTLQIIGLALIFYSSYLYEITYMIDISLVLSRIIPFSWLFSIPKFVKLKLFRPKIKLLTKKEYNEQGKKETLKALEELRGYCSSPECNPWKTVSKLKNPQKFADFMNGSNHLSDDEIEEYDSLSIKANGTIITDDSDSIEEYSEDSSF